MNIKKLLSLGEKEVITIVGAGGKTSLMYVLSKELRDKKVLMSTTTKIYIPSKKWYDILCLEPKKLYLKPIYSGVYVLGKGINEKGKIIGIDDEILDQVYSLFDYILLEGDGAKEKCIKGWRENEPVVYHKTTKTIGIINILTVGYKIDPENVHRVEKFCEIADSNVGDRITVDHLYKMILHKNGLFKHSKGKKILWINAVEGSKAYKNAVELKDKLKSTDIDIYMGSLKNKEIEG